MRVKRGTVRRAKHKKIIKAAKGFKGRRKSVFKLAKQAVIKAGQYSYRDRRVQKRKNRSLSIIKINAASREHEISYSVLINKLKNNNITLNRKVLSILAENHPSSFDQVIKEIK